MSEYKTSELILLAMMDYYAGNLNCGGRYLGLFSQTSRCFIGQMAHYNGISDTVMGNIDAGWCDAEYTIENESVQELLSLQDPHGHLAMLQHGFDSRKTVVGENSEFIVDEDFVREAIRVFEDYVSMGD